MVCSTLICFPRPFQAHQEVSGKFLVWLRPVLNSWIFVVHAVLNLLIVNITDIEIRLNFKGPLNNLVANKLT